MAIAVRKRRITRTETVLNERLECGVVDGLSSRRVADEDWREQRQFDGYPGQALLWRHLNRTYRMAKGY